MSDPLFKELNFERIARLVQRASGGAHPIAVVEASGEVVWSSEGAADTRLTSILLEVNERDGLASDGESVGRIEVGSGRTLLHAAVRPEALEQVGSLVAVVEGDLSSEHWDALSESLVDASACIASEYQLQTEMTEMAGEISARYEELNLVYSLEDQTRALDSGDVGATELLRNIAMFMKVDVAAFVQAGRAKPLFATNLSRPIPNLDLIITVLRGDVFRFVCAGNRPLVLNDLDEVLRPDIFMSMPHRMLALPLIQGGSEHAMLVLLRHPDEPFFTSGDRNLARMIANQTAIVLRNQSLVGELTKFGEQMAAALIEAVEAKDPYTRGHSERVQSISTAIGRGADLRAAQIQSISWGALLHDVGKIGIPDRVLCKVGRLTADEFTLITMHPERSYEILKHVDHLGVAAHEAARYHQEKFDGTGYPHRLSGDEIPTEARVIAVADTYDAITSSRPYRAGQSHRVAMEEIRRVAGTQLDPAYVTILEKLCDESMAWLVEITGKIDPDDG